MLDKDNSGSKILSLRGKIYLNPDEGFTLDDSILEGLNENEIRSVKRFFDILLIIIYHFPSQLSKEGSEEFRYVHMLSRIQGLDFEPGNLASQAVSVLNNLSNGNIAIDLQDITSDSGHTLSILVSTDIEATGSIRSIIIPKMIDSIFGTKQLLLNLLSALIMEEKGTQSITDLDESIDAELQNQIRSLDSFAESAGLLLSGYAESFIVFLSKLVEWIHKMNDFDDNSL